MSKTHPIYQSIVTDLRENRRPSVTLTPETISEIEELWQNALDPPVEAQLTPLLCILRHSKTFAPRLDPLFYRTLSLNDAPPQILVLALAALSRQVLDRCEQRGESLPRKFIETLRALLKHPEPKVFAWSLRTIELMGSQSVLLKKEILQRRWGARGLFNPHLRTAKRIIALLKQRWK